MKFGIRGELGGVGSTRRAKFFSSSRDKMLNRGPWGAGMVWRVAFIIDWRRIIAPSAARF